MFALANVMNLFAYELPGLGGRRLTLAGIFVGPLDRLLLRHNLCPLK